MSINNQSISAIVIINPKWSKDLQMLPDCIKSVAWVDEIILVVSEMVDGLSPLIKKFDCRVVKQDGGSFSDWRNLGAAEASGKWLLYIDADERVTEKLKSEVLSKIKSSDSVAGYAIPRSNSILGKEFRYAGWWPDYVLRLFKTHFFVKWDGDLHEQPLLKGEIGYLKNSLIHLKHQDLESFVNKTIVWSIKEAELYQKSGHPKLNTIRFWRLTIHPFITSFINRYFFKKGYLDGTEGLIDAIYQSYSQFINFARLWEMQYLNKTE